MKTITINLYEFNELSEKAQRHALNKMWDINIDYEWWDWTYEDALNVGCIIKGFDLGRGKSVNLVIDNEHIEVAQKIVENWGETCDGYKESKQFIEDFETVDEDILDNLKHKYKDVLEKTFWNMLQEDYDYKISDEAIKETIESNEYYFTESGNLSRFSEKNELTTEQAKNKLRTEGYLVGCMWSSEDIKHKASETGINLDDNQIKNVIENIEKYFDGEYGINWDSIEDAIQNEI